MQCPVDHVEQQLALGLQAEFLCIGQSRIPAHNHVADQLAVLFGRFEGKGQDICGIIVIEILLVQAMDRRVIDDRNADFRAQNAPLLHELPHRALQQLDRQVRGHVIDDFQLQHFQPVACSGYLTRAWNIAFSDLIKLS